jgi:hypothetical protein
MFRHIGNIYETEFTKEQISRVDQARDEFHRATLDVLKEAGIDYGALDITEAGESIALEGFLQFQDK